MQVGFLDTAAGEMPGTGFPEVPQRDLSSNGLLPYMRTRWLAINAASMPDFDCDHDQFLIFNVAKYPIFAYRVTPFFR